MLHKNTTFKFYFMSDIFIIRDLGVCRKAQFDDKTAFTYFEVKAGVDIWNRNLPLNYIIFIFGGVIEISCNEFENRYFQQGEMVFMLRSSSVHVKVVKNAKLYVMYFETFLSPCDNQLFKAYVPDVEKIVYDFRPIRIPKEVFVFLKQTRSLQAQKVDCKHFNSLKHNEFFLLFRHFCPREDLIMFLSPLIGKSMSFRSRVLEKYSQLKSARVTELADSVGLGRKNFYKYFINEFGISPAKWMMQERAKRLLIFLSEPDVTISDAMDKFHFNSPGHFNRFCHQYFKTSPGAIISGKRNSRMGITENKNDTN